MKDIVLEINKLVWRGRGIGRAADGRTVMLEPGALPGETVRAKITAVKKDYLCARVLEIMAVSEHRRRHPCALADKCFACSLGVAKHAFQSEVRRDLALEVLQRELGRNIDVSGLNPEVLVSRPFWRYRFRAQVHVIDGIPNYYAQGSHDPIPLHDCLLWRRELSAGVLRKARELPDGRFVFGMGNRDFEVKSEKCPGFLRFYNPEYDLSYELKPGAFFQANWKLNIRLTGLVAQMLGNESKIADLYAGAGNFSLPLARTGREVLAVEADGLGVESGIHNVRLNRLSGVRFLKRDLGKEGNIREMREFMPGGVVLDPPRAGGGPVCAGLAKISSVRRIVWVSCDLMNACRDLRPLLNAGFSLTRFVIADMFPQTSHLEAVMLLQR